VDDSTIAALRRDLGAAPDDLNARARLARLLLDAGRLDEAMVELGELLRRDPSNAEARRLLTVALAAPAAASEPPEPAPAPATDAESGTAQTGFDWTAAEHQVNDLVEPMFVSEAGGDHEVPAYDVEASTVTLADVGGMTNVKKRLNSAFLAPLQNPKLRELYGKSLRGGLLLYGPPGCGKTFLARAIAGELGAKFLTVGLSDILDPYVGMSEHNLHEVFQLARREAPVVLFLDELDALGARRSMTRNSGTRGVVVQLLQEMDGISSLNDGIFVLAATNQPWDVDPALRRPGRLDRTLLVLPPDEPAREAIFRTHLRDRPVEGVKLATLAARSDGLTGADIAYVCELASEGALLDSVETGVARTIGMADLESALAEVRPSSGPWLESARNAVDFGEDDGTFAELKAYLKKVKRL
jgi:SpoVK/Ycf46/Vps4 family AAA+-type ATPase